jgi:hypothetical protein
MEPIILPALAMTLIPIVMALVSLVKIYIDSKWSPLFALAFGISGAILIPDISLSETIIDGLVIGLTASGLYSGVRSVVQ